MKRLGLCLWLLSVNLVYAQTPSVQALYQQHCQDCHGVDRLGGMGPALLPDNLTRLRQNKAQQVITVGRPATQMPGFSNTLSKDDIQRLAQWIYTPPAIMPEWTKANIEQSRQVFIPESQRPGAPQHAADPQNLFVVVELGDHHATILDGDTFEPLTRFKTHYAVHGGPKYTPDGHYVYFSSRDGWILQFDMYSLKPVAEIRVGINTRNIAVSHDGRHLIAANYLPHSLVILNTHDLSLVQVLPVASVQGQSSRVSAVYAAPPRASFVAALKDVKEFWEITEQKGRWQVRQVATDDYLDDFFFDSQYRYLIGASRKGDSASVIDLDTGKAVKGLPLPGMPHLGSGISWVRNGKRVMATPHLKEAAISVIDMNTWQTIATITTNGPGFFMRSHANTPYLWADVFFGPNREQVHVIDKQSLKIVKTLVPAPGKTAAHVEFTKDGRYALVSIWDMEGAVVVYDAKTLEEVKRIPMVKPSGKYNVWNKTHYEEGTSH